MRSVSICSICLGFWVFVGTVVADDAGESVSTKGDAVDGRSPADTALLIYHRIAGVPPSKEELDKMVELIKRGSEAALSHAALLPTKSASFYNIKLRDMFDAWSNVTGSNNVPLNDMVATMIGMVRDDHPFDEVLYGDVIYTAKDDLVDSKVKYTEGYDLIPARLCPVGDDNRITVPYSSYDNFHYMCLDNYYNSVDLQEALHEHQQSTLGRGNLMGGYYWDKPAPQPPMSTQAIAGILSTRAFAKAFFSAGTNRRATSFVLKNFLCHEMEELHDIYVNDTRVRTDVSRAPGGLPQMYKSRCVGCHAGLDALSGWNVFYDYAEREGIGAELYGSHGHLIYNPGLVHKKIYRNIVYAQGYDYRQSDRGNDSFVNEWAKGKNKKLGWRGEQSGNGAKAWGMMLSASKAFSTCMAKHVFRQVCFSGAEDSKDNAQAIVQLGTFFENSGYNMRKLFAATAKSCLLRK